MSGQLKPCCKGAPQRRAPLGPICRLVSEGEGLAVVNRMMAAGYADDLGLVLRLFVPQTVERFALIGNPAATGGLPVEEVAAMLADIGQPPQPAAR